MTGCMLYWAEGSKRRNDVEFTNSDPDMVRKFVEFLSRCYGVAPDDVRLTLNVHLDNGLRLGARTRRSLPYGTARVVVHSRFVVQSIYGAIQEYAGASRPEWIDL